MNIFKQHTQNILGRVVSRDIAGLAEADLVNSGDSELVLGAVHQPCHQEFGGLELFWDVALSPVFSFSSLTFHQVADDLTATIIGRFGPAEADGTLGGIHNFGEGRWSRRICRT